MRPTRSATPWRRTWWGQIMWASQMSSCSRVPGSWRHWWEEPQCSSSRWQPWRGRRQGTTACRPVTWRCCSRSSKFCLRPGRRSGRRNCRSWCCGSMRGCWRYMGEQWRGWDTSSGWASCSPHVPHEGVRAHHTQCPLHGSSRERYNLGHCNTGHLNSRSQEHMSVFDVRE